jgi:putative membrane protein
MAAIAITFAACSGSSKTTSTDSSTVVKDSTTVVKTDTTQMAADSGDATFAKKAAIGGMAEVALGKLALSKTSDKSIKDFATMMVDDHGKANEELMTVAKGKNMMLPATVDAEHQAKMDSLKSLSGAAFDKGYVAVMVEGHQKTLDLMQMEASNGKDAELKAFAAKTAPVVKMHLDMITKIQSGQK